MNRSAARYPSVCAALLLALCATTARAETYQVDLIVFTQSGSEAGRPARVPDLTRAVDPEATASLRNFGIRVLPEGTGGLETMWHRLANGRRYTPLKRLSWIQTDPPESRGPALHITGGATIDTPTGTLRGLDGTVALYAGHYLHLDTDLVWTQRGADGQPVSWRLKEDRSLRRDELNYLDSPRLGVLVKVSKAGG